MSKFRFDPDKKDPTDPSTTMTNGRRAQNAEEAVLTACLARGEADNTPGEDSVRDLLADLGHLCDREGWDFRALVRTALKDWRAER